MIRASRLREQGGPTSMQAIYAAVQVVAKANHLTDSRWPVPAPA